MLKKDISRMDYLKAIYNCMEADGYAGNKKLAESLAVSSASVTEMVKKLVNLGDVYLEKKNIYLSSKGIEEVKKIFTKHRLWEIFLVEQLGYSWNDVHEEADMLEHATSDKLKDRLNEFLNRPEHCPHGSEVFENHKGEDNLVRLDNLVEGDAAYIHKVVDEKKLLEYLEQKNIRLNQKISVKKVDKYDGSLLLETDKGEVIIALIAAKQIMVMNETQFE